MLSLKKITIKNLKIMDGLENFGVQWEFDYHAYELKDKGTNYYKKIWLKIFGLQ